MPSIYMALITKNHVLSKDSLTFCTSNLIQLLFWSSDFSVQKLKELPIPHKIESNKTVAYKFTDNIHYFRLKTTDGSVQKEGYVTCYIKFY